MNHQEALNELYALKTRMKSQNPYDPTSQDAVIFGNEIEHIIDKASLDIVRLYEIGYELGPGLTPLPGEQKKNEFEHVYESMERHIARCRKAVENAKSLAALRKEKKLDGPRHS